MRGTTIELLWSHGIVCPLVRRSSRCAWGFYVAWKAGLHHKALFPHSTPERQSLCESHRQRRWLTHWSYSLLTRSFTALRVPLIQRVWYKDVRGRPYEYTTATSPDNC